MNIFSTFVADYDRMINWEKRLQNETPFYKKIFLDSGAQRILDVGCATGRHAMLFSSWGMQVSGADPSAEMIDIAKDNAKEAGRLIDFKVAGFEEIDEVFEPYFDVIMCIGNSLAHIMSSEALERAFRAANNLLIPGGILLIQIRNYQRAYEKNEKYMPLNTKVADGKEYLYFRYNELNQDTVNFNIVSFVKEQNGQWSYTVNSEELRPWNLQEIREILDSSGLTVKNVYGDFKFSPFNQSESQDMIIFAEKMRR